MLPATRPTPEPVQSSPKPKAPEPSDRFARKISLTLTSPVASIVRPKPYSATRSAVERAERGEAVAEVAPVAARDSLLALQEAPGNARDQDGGEQERRRVHPVDDVGAGEADERAGDHRADRGGDPFGAL